MHAFMLSACFILFYHTPYFSDFKQVFLLKFLQREFEKSYQNKTLILIFFAVRETNCLQKDLNKTKKKVFKHF